VVHSWSLRYDPGGNKGGGTVRLQLQPPDLGRLEIHIRVGNDGVVSMHMVSHTSEARSLVHSQLSDLHASLQDRGFEVGDLSVAVQDQDPQSEERGDERASRSPWTNESELGGAIDPANVAAPAAWRTHYGLIDYIA